MKMNPPPLWGRMEIVAPLPAQGITNPVQTWRPSARDIRVYHYWKMDKHKSPRCECSHCRILFVLSYIVYGRKMDASPFSQLQPFCRDCARKLRIRKEVH